jgi:Myb-like DNA-binding domain
VLILLPAQAVPQRTVMAVYKHVHRMYDPSKQQGKWTTYEDSILLQYVLDSLFSGKIFVTFAHGRAVGDLGRAWQNVSKRVGRAGDDCRDRYRYLADHKHCNSGQLTTPFKSAY